MKGRKPIPINSKKTRGTFRKDRHPESVVDVPSEIPAPPDHLSQNASVEWGRISQELYRLGLLSRIDRAALAAYCQVYGRWVEAERFLSESELMITTSNGNVIQSPLVGIANKALEIMHKYLTEFGMTPSSRARVSAEKPNSKQSNNPFAKFNNGS